MRGAQKENTRNIPAGGLSAGGLPRITDLVFLAFLFWFGSYADLFVYNQGGPPPVRSYMVFLGFFVVVSLLRASQGVPILSRADFRRASGLIGWLYAFVLLVALSYLMSSQSEVATQRLITMIEMALILAAFTSLMLVDRMHRLVGLTMVGVALLGTLLNVYDFIDPTFSTVPGRAAGMYGNPTISGFIITLALVVAVTHVPLWFRWPLVGVVAVGVILTFSRASWLVLFLSIVWMSWNGYLGGRSTRQLFGLGAVVAAGVVVYGLLSGTLLQLIAATPLYNYLDPNTMARLGLGAFASDFAAAERGDVVRFAWQSYVESGNALFGNGLGHTHEWAFRVSTHNMYLLFLVEAGILGLLVYVSLLFVLWRSANGLGKLLVIQIVVYGFFSHNVLDAPAGLIFIAAVIAGVCAAKPQDGPASVRTNNLHENSSRNNRSNRGRRRAIATYPPSGRSQ